MRRFEGTDSYIATADLRAAVNAAIALERPLLVKGEPGTGKTILAHEIARSIDKQLITWHIKSTTKAQQGLYEYDAVSRLRDGQLGDERVHTIANYIVPGKLWEAFAAEEAPVLLIDEIRMVAEDLVDDAHGAVVTGDVPLVHVRPREGERRALAVERFEGEDVLRELVHRVASGRRPAHPRVKRLPTDPLDGHLDLHPVMLRLGEGNAIGDGRR